MNNYLAFKANVFSLLVAFILCPGTSSSQLTRLTYPDLSQNSHFGREFDIHDDYIVVAEPNFTDTDQNHKGRAHVYRRQGDTWAHDGFLDNAPVKAYSHFGNDISMHEEDLVISAPDMAAGGVFTYSRVGEDWQLGQQLTIPTELHRENPFIQFGENVEMHDEWLVVSAPGYRGTNHPIMRTSAVFIYKKIGASWTFHQMILPPDISKSTQFGNDIEMSASAILISAAKGDGGADKSGAVFLYRLEEDTWVPDYTFINPSSKPHELFGADVDMHDDIIVIGTPMHTEDMDNGPHGAAHVYQRFGSTWIRTAFLEASDGKRNDMFGSAVAVADGNIFIGAPRHDEPGKADAGKVYHYVLQNSFWVEKTSYLALMEDIQPHMHFGGNLEIHDHQLVISGHLMTNDFIDGGVAYVTDIESVTATADNPFSSLHLDIHPNPVGDILYMTLQGEWGHSILTTIYSQDGHSVGQKEISYQPGMNVHSMDVSALVPGHYFLQANDGDRTSIYKWIKI